MFAFLFLFVGLMVALAKLLAPDLFYVNAGVFWMLTLEVREPVTKRDCWETITEAGLGCLDFTYV